MTGPNESGDDALREAFAAVRAARESGAGRYHDFVQQARWRAQVRRRRARQRIAFALAGAVPVAAVAALGLHERKEERQALAIASQAQVIAEWRSPTASLLDDSQTDWMREVPSLHASVLDPQSESGGGSQ
jgi:hypothetical protein